MTAGRVWDILRRGVAMVGRPWERAPALAGGDLVEEVSREAERFLVLRAHDEPPAALLVTVRDAAGRAEVAARAADPRFADEVIGVLRATGARHRVPARIFVRYEAGERDAIEISDVLPTPAPARLTWPQLGAAEGGVAPLTVAAGRTTCYVGRGVTRRRMPGLPNDVCLPEALDWVSRDAFWIAWNPGRGGWELGMDGRAQAATRVRRAGRFVPLQRLPLALADGDVIELCGAAASQRLEITFKSGTNLDNQKNDIRGEGDDNDNGGGAS